MNNPTSKQVRKVVETLKNVLPMAVLEDNLNMQCVLVNKDRSWTIERPYPCGTIHCVGGWYAIAKGLHKTDKYIGYEDGALAMAKDLGFGYQFGRNEIGNLCFWADENPEMWGNYCGKSMFSSAAAYNGAKNIQQVIEHWDRIADRLEALELAEVKKEPSRTDITKDLVKEEVEERLDVVKEVVLSNAQ